MSVEDPEALNLDGSRYGIAVCLSTVSTANWTFSADGGGEFLEEALSVLTPRKARLCRLPFHP